MPHLLKSSRIIPLCTIHVFFDDCAMAKYHKERHNITMCHERNKMQLLYIVIYTRYTQSGIINKCCQPICMSCNELIAFLVRSMTVSSSESQGRWPRDQPSMKESNQQLVIVKEWWNINCMRAVPVRKRVALNKLFKGYQQSGRLSVTTCANCAS